IERRFPLCCEDATAAKLLQRDVEAAEAGEEVDEVKALHSLGHAHPSRVRLPTYRRLRTVDAVLAADPRIILRLTREHSAIGWKDARRWRQLRVLVQALTRCPFGRLPRDGIAERRPHRLSAPNDANVLSFWLVL